MPLLEIILPHPRLVKSLEISIWLSMVGSRVRSSSILLVFLVSNYALFDLPVIRLGKGGIKGSVSRELGSII